MTGHSIRWFVWAGGVKSPRTAMMRGRWDGYDAACSCGWSTGNSCMVRREISDAIYWHKHDAAKLLSTNINN